MKFAADSWVEVRDASGTILHSGTNRAGSTRSVQGTAPFTLVVGNAANVTGFLNMLVAARDAQALQTLTIAYCLLPCVLKLIAGGALHWLVIRRPARSAIQPV